MSLAKAIQNNEFVVTAECRPPCGTAPERLKACAVSLGGSVHAISAPESEDGIRLCSLSACSHLMSAGAEPILNLLTRDLNRIALQSTILGAASMGVKNILCMSGRHQALTDSGSARGVNDVDPIQLLRIADAMRKEGKLANGQAMDSPIELLQGTDTNPFSDPVELQVLTLARTVASGADFVITQPVFNIDRFNQWLSGVREKGISTQTCIIASVMPITSAIEAFELTEKYRFLDIPKDIIERVRTAGDHRAAGVHMATETIERLRNTEGVRGIHIMTGDDFELAVEVIKSSGLSRS